MVPALKLQHDGTVSNPAFCFNLRHYMMGDNKQHYVGEVEFNKLGCSKQQLTVGPAR
jgi:hypothetical protein